MTTVKARYECLGCLRFIWGGDVVWKLPEGAVMTDDLRSRLTGPYCPHCGSDNVHEVLPEKDSGENGPGYVGGPAGPFEG